MHEKRAAYNLFKQLDLVGKCISPIACPVVALHVKPEFAAEHFVVILRKACQIIRSRVRNLN